ncbi:hypothetical protein [Pararhizobium sp. O133]|uniref:hypothetical protein n=1 Tax=Pararhizobium sp. O133 TaxID=3449278 RepID=UPI003F689288
MCWRSLFALAVFHVCSVACAAPQTGLFHVVPVTENTDRITLLAATFVVTASILLVDIAGSR